MPVPSRSCHYQDEGDLLVRAGKLLKFLRHAPDPAPILTPQPWKERHPRYYIGEPLHNADGHGGYTRRNLFDRMGIPYRLREGLAEYHPLVVSRYAMRMLDVAESTNDEEARRKAYSVLPSLVRSSTATGALGRGPDPERMISVSAHANVQGVVLSALIRLHEGAPDREGRRAIEAVARRLVRPVAEGGTLGTVDGDPFLQEAPGTGVKHVLNGCLYGLFALYDLRDALGDERARDLCGRLERSLDRIISRYTTSSGWSLYALKVYDRPYLASVYYHALHVSLARVISLKTGSSRLALESARWQQALRSPVTRLAAAGRKTAQVLWLRDLLRLRLDVCP